MKKKLLFAGISACLLLLNSCSGDDNKSNGSNNNSATTVSFKINGVAKTLNTATVTARPPEADGDVILTAVATDGAGTSFDFGVYKGRLGNQGSAKFNINGTLYSGTTNGAFGNYIMYFTQSDDHHLKGTFSGPIGTSTGNIAVITDGVFNINY